MIIPNRYLQYLSHVDLPGYSQIEKLARALPHLVRITDTLGLAFIATVVAYFGITRDMRIIAAIPVIVLGASTFAYALRSFSINGAFWVRTLGIGAFLITAALILHPHLLPLLQENFPEAVRPYLTPIVYRNLGEALWGVLIFGTAAALAGAALPFIFALTLLIVLGAINGLVRLGRYGSFPFSVPVIWLMNRSIRHTPGWTRSNGKPLLILSVKNGVDLHAADFEKPVFVEKPSMRNGQDQPKDKIVRLTFDELLAVQKGRPANPQGASRGSKGSSAASTSGAAVATASGATAALAATAAAYTSSDILDDLPIFDDSLYNPTYNDINPGSGLPTIAGPGSYDVAGNSWGTSDNSW